MTVESPPEQPQAPPLTPQERQMRTRFTAERAKIYQARAVIARQAAKLLPKDEPGEPRQAKPDPLVAIVLSEISRVSEVLSKPKLKPSERVALIGALDRLMDRLRVLQGTPLPGSSRPVSPAKVETAASAMLGQQSAGGAIQPGREDQD